MRSAVRSRHERNPGNEIGAILISKGHRSPRSPDQVSRSPSNASGWPCSAAGGIRAAAFPTQMTLPPRSASPSIGSVSGSGKGACRSVVSRTEPISFEVHPARWRQSAACEGAIIGPDPESVGVTGGCIDRGEPSVPRNWPDPGSQSKLVGTRNTLAKVMRLVPRRDRLSGPWGYQGSSRGRPCECFQLRHPAFRPADRQRQAWMLVAVRQVFDDPPQSAKSCPASAVAVRSSRRRLRDCVGEGRVGILPDGGAILRLEACACLEQVMSQTDRLARTARSF